MKGSRDWGWAVVAVALVGLSGCGGGTGGETDRTTTTQPAPKLTFYKPDGTLTSGEPGDILAQEQIPLADDLHGTGYRITYVSTTPSGDRVPVTGIVIVPNTPKPADGYPVVAWAHGTTGIGDQCAPSGFAPYPLLGGAPLLDAGYAVAATDYEGLGTPTEIHPYLVGVAEGHSVIDSVRAARHFGGGTKAALWGWSQGGHAALLRPPVAAVLRARARRRRHRGRRAGHRHHDLPRPGRSPTRSCSRTRPRRSCRGRSSTRRSNLEDLVVVADAEKARLAEQACTGDIKNNVTRPLDEIFRSDPQNSETWKQAIAINSAAVGDTETPVMLTHGEKDTLVPEQRDHRAVRRVLHGRRPHRADPPTRRRPCDRVSIHVHAHAAVDHRPHERRTARAVRLPAALILPELASCSPGTQDDRHPGGYAATPSSTTNGR